MSSKLSYPIIDAHFWVVRDGQIIDPYFSYYDLVKKLNMLTGDRIYLEAADIVQKVIIRKFQSVIDWGEVYKIMKKINYTQEENQCYQNCLYEIMENGGELKFGSMGWKFKTSDKIHYEYGGENWSLKQFIK